VPVIGFPSASVTVAVTVNDDVPVDVDARVRDSVAEMSDVEALTAPITTVEVVVGSPESRAPFELESFQNVKV